MPTASGSIAYLGAARFQGYWNASTNNATGSGLPGSATGQFSTLLVNGGYDASTDLTASAGDYWQVTGSGTTTVDGQSLWSLNDWCIYSGSAGSSSGTWRKLAFEDTIASVIVGDLSASEVFNLTGSSNKQVLFITGASDSDVVMSGSNNFTFDYDNNNLSLTGALYLNQTNGVYLDADADSRLYASSDDVVVMQIGGEAQVGFYDGAVTALASDVQLGTVANSFNGLFLSDDIQITGNIKISDDKKIYLGSDHDAHIEYNEDGDKFLIISGSSAGVALSGSTVSINGSLLLSVSTLGAPSTSQDSFYVLDATDGAIKTTTIDATLGAIVADDGGLARSSSQLLISGSNIATAAVTVSADEVLMLDADGTIKRETFVDLASAMAASNGGLVASSGALLLSGSNLADAAVATTDEFIFIDADGSVKRDSITDLLTAISGDGLDVASEQLKVNLSEVIANDGNNRLLTSDGDGTATAESSLTYDGTTFNVHDDLDITGSLSGQLSGSVEFKINMKHNNTGQFSDQSGNQFLYLVPSGVTRGPAINAVGGGNSGLGFATSGSSKARIFHNEEGDKLLVISGSSAGVVLSGSSIALDGKLVGSNDLDTYIDISDTVNDQINLVAGGFTLGTFYGAGAKNVTINALSEDVDFKVNQDAGKALFMSGSDGIIHAHYGITLHDDNKLHFGGSNDAFVEYNEDGDNFLVISGSSAGLALSGSVVKIDGQLTLTDASSITASNGGLVASGGTLLVSGSNIADDAIDPSGDELIFLTTGSIKRESVNDFVTAIAGPPGKGLRNAGDGTLELHFAEISAVSPLASADSVMILDNGSQTKRATVSTLGTYLAGTGLNSSSGVLSVAAADDEKIYFGTDNDAHIEYNEDGDDLLVISGSSAGLVLSGSTIDIGGFGNGSTITKLNGKVGVNDFDPKVVFSTTSNYQMVTFENQLSDGEGGGERLIYSPGANDTLTAGQIYFLHTDGTWDQADGSAMSTGGNQLLAVGFAGSSQQVGVLLRGFVRIPSTEILNVPGSGAVDGLPVYVSTTAGHFDFTPPSSSGEFVRVVGHAIDDDGGDVLVYFNPSPLGAANP